MRKKPSQKARAIHVELVGGAAEVLVVPAPATLKMLGTGNLLITLKGRQLAYIPRVAGFWEIGSISFHPTPTLGVSDYERDTKIPDQSDLDAAAGRFRIARILQPSTPHSPTK